MNSRFETSNIVALMIAILLIAAGFTLGFIHRQTESVENQQRVMTTPNKQARPTAEADQPPELND